MGVVGIHIHGLENAEGKVSQKGSNPLASIDYGNTAKKLSAIVNCYDPKGNNSQKRYEVLASLTVASIRGRLCSAIGYIRF